MAISSTFFIKAMFSGNYDAGCGMTFNIIDTDVIYHLDFRLNTKGAYRKLIQASRWNGRWAYKIPEMRSDLPDLALENDIIVLVTDEYFEMTVNNIMISPKFAIDLERLYNYKGVNLVYRGECIWVDLQKSYMTNGGDVLISFYICTYQSLQHILFCPSWWLVDSEIHSIYKGITKPLLLFDLE